MVEVNLPNYKKFDNVYDVYSNFIQKVMKVIEKVAPIKRNSREWLDSEISKKLIIQNKLFQRCKKSSS